MGGPSPRRRLPKLPSGLAAGIIGFGLVALLALAGVVERLENLAGDTLRRRLAEPLDDRIALVALDDASLARAEEEFDVPWPWPRETYGQAVAFFRKAGATAVVFDFVFTSRSPRGPEDDEAFAAAAREFGGVVAALSTKPEAQPSALARFRRLAPSHGVDAPASLPGLDAARSVEAPPEPLWSAFAAVGDVSDLADSDGLRRRVRLVRRMDDRAFPSLALAAFRTARGATPLGFDDGNFRLGDASFPAHADGSVSLLFRRLPEGRRPTPLFDVVSSEAGTLEGKPPLVDPATFRGKIVLVGGTAPGLLDLRPTPVARLVGSSAGYFVHATALDNLLTGRALRVVPVHGAGWVVLLLLALGAGLAAERLPVAGAVALIVGAALLLGTAAVAAYARADTLLPVAAPMLAVAGAAAAGAAERGIREGRRRRAIQAALGQFLSPAVFTKLLADERPLETGGERYEVSLFFSDLQGFTSFSEELDPKALVEILNLYLTEMADVVVGEQGGYVDKYIGDAIMAFWGAPLPNERHAEAACRAAWRCQLRLARIQPELARRGLSAGPEGMVMRIGLHTGEAVIGLMGSERKLNYTAMGDSVNLASRLEGANKAYGTRILLSDAIRVAAGGAIAVRELDRMRVKGKQEPTRIWELAGVSGEPPGPLDSARLDDWERAMALYRGRRFAEARAAFERFLAAKPGDGPAALYVSRCRSYEAAPPPADWDGVFTMTTK